MLRYKLSVCIILHIFYMRKYLLKINNMIATQWIQLH